MPPDPDRYLASDGQREATASQQRPRDFFVDDTCIDCATC
jgi:hypothetical protein